MKIRQLFPVVAVFLTATACGHGHGTEVSERADSVRRAIDSYLATYPGARYQDVYKNFMQDYFGPGHLLADTARAAAGIQGELEGCTEFYGPAYEPAGYRTNFYRVNLSLVADSTVGFPQYFDAFVRSVNGIEPPAPEVWQAEWSVIDSALMSTGYGYPGVETDRRAILDRLAEGNYVAHHSREFNELYKVHYRIMSRDIFEGEILPLIRR
ncbi:MAG: hypothetical protein K2M19_08970 [Muribaculaceae bacterium]|nr:hypothetical protein [Muribaculaceae bacterium]